MLYNLVALICLEGLSIIVSTWFGWRATRLFGKGGICGFLATKKCPKRKRLIELNFLFGVEGASVFIGYFTSWCCLGGFVALFPMNCENFVFAFVHKIVSPIPDKQGHIPSRSWGSQGHPKLYIFKGGKCIF